MSDRRTYEIALVQTREAISYFDENLFKKIPQGLIDMLNKFQLDDYDFEIDESKTFEEQGISKEAKELLSAIFIQYCCDKDDRNEILRKCKENDEIREQQAREQYNPNNIFKKKEETAPKVESVEMVKYEENKPWYLKIVDKIKNLFKRS